MMRYLLPLLFFTFSFFILGQADCSDAMYGCTIGNFTTNSNGSGAINDLPNGNNISNPFINPGAAGNSGCLLSGELNPTWIILTVSSPGFLEFTLGSPGSSGFYDWALWPYYDSNDPLSIAGGDACAEIQNNLLPPVACNYNASSGGYTGMMQQGNLPPGGVQGNFEYSFWANAGEQYVLCFSNWSGLVGTSVPIYTGTDIANNGNSNNSASVTCDPSSLSTVICLGDTANVVIDAGGIPNPIFTFLNDAGDVVGGTGPAFDIVPSDTTTYMVQITNGLITDTVSVVINVAFPPTPNAGSDFTVCMGNQGNLNGIANPNNDIQWNYVGMGIINFTPDNLTLNPQITASTPGIYFFELNEDNNICPVEKDTVMVTFEDPALTVQGIDVSCPGESDGEIQITSATADSYSFDNGNTWQGSPIMTGLPGGSYDVCIKTINGCTACDKITLVEGDLIPIIVSADTLICENGTATLSAAVANGTGFDYHWSHTANTSPVQQVTPDVLTNYVVYANKDNGCSSQKDTITVDILPPITVTTSPTQFICKEDTATITASATGGNGGPYNFVWTDINGTVISNTDMAFVSPNTASSYTVTVTDGCESSPSTAAANVDFIMNEPPSFLVNVNDSCPPASFQIVNNSTPGLVTDVYWYISNGDYFDNENVIDVEIEKPGQYDVQMIVVTSDGCRDTINVKNALTVYPKPSAGFAHLPNPITTLHTDNIQFQNFTINGNSYEWSFEQGTPSYSDLTNPVVSFPIDVADEYTVQLIAFSEHNCVDSLTRIVKVIPEVMIYAPNSFTPDGDNYNDQWKVFIDGIDIYNFTLEIYNRWGEKLWESHDVNAAWSGTYGFNNDRVPVGTYIWKIRANDSYTDKKLEWQGHVNVLY